MNYVVSMVSNEHEMIVLNVGVRLGVVACACNLATWRPGCGISWDREFWHMGAHVDRASTLSTAPIWMTCRRAGCPGRLRRGGPAQGGNPAGKSPRVVR